MIKITMMKIIPRIKNEKYLKKWSLCEWVFLTVTITVTNKSTYRRKNKQQ